MQHVLRKTRASIYYVRCLCTKTDNEGYEYHHHYELGDPSPTILPENDPTMNPPGTVS